MNKGNLQRRWSKTEPPVYDKETRMVCLDIQPKTREEDGEPEGGFSFLQVEIDSLMDYGHIKSQLIEAGFPQKDEFGLLMNAVNSILNAVGESSSWAKFKENLDLEDIEKFGEFCEFRAICATAAREVMRHYES